MATSNLLYRVIFIFTLITLTTITTATTTTALLHRQHFLSPLTSLTEILTTLGYIDLATASHTLSLSSDLHLPRYNPITVFAATDTSLRSCTSCFLPFILKQHSLPALYPFNYLQKNILFGTKIETLHRGYCLTVTSTVASNTVFINGVEITHPNLYVSDTVIVHGIQGFISHLSPYSCVTKSLMTLLPLKPPVGEPARALTSMMITDAMIRLRTNGFSVLALALRVKFTELSNLHNMTIFAVNDVSIFKSGNAYVQNLKYHIIPNRVLMFDDLEKLEGGTKLLTLDIGEFLTVTSAGGGSVLSPMRINDMKITQPNLIYNRKLVVHGISSAFPHMRSLSSDGLGEFGGTDVSRSNDDMARSSKPGGSDVSRSSDEMTRSNDPGGSDVSRSSDEMAHSSDPGGSDVSRSSDEMARSSDPGGSDVSRSSDELARSSDPRGSDVSRSSDQMSRSSDPGGSDVGMSTDDVASPPVMGLTAENDFGRDGL